MDALKASADQEFTIAERLSSKARNSFALAAGFFVVAQTVAFGSFEQEQLGEGEKDWLIRLAGAAAVFLIGAIVYTLKTDATYKSGDLPLAKLEDALNAAYAGDPDVTGNLGSYYIGVVRTRREANKRRRVWYYLTLGAVVASIGATSAELIYALISRTN